MITRDTVRQAVVILTFVLTLTANGLANGLPLNGLTTAEISDSFPVLFVPAGYVFAIWGLIYLTLTGFVIYQALPAQRENPRLRRIGYWFALSNIANTTWIFLWHYQQFLLTELAMLGVFASLVMVYEGLGIGRQTVNGAERWFVNLPFSIYLGWITVATVANTTIVLYDLGWDGFGIADATWAAVLLVVATVITSLMILRRRDLVYAGVIVWAFAGIAVKQSATPLVATTAVIMAVVIVVVALGRTFLRHSSGPGESASSGGRKARANA
jgi:hypothetical protein